MRYSINISNTIGYILIGLILTTIIVMYYKKQTRLSTMESVINTLYRQCARWAVAAEQDDSEIIRVLHANYATGYLWALKDIVTTDDFKKITGEDFLEFEKRIVTIQDTATQKLVTKCASVIPNSDPQLLKAIYQTSNALP